MIEDLELTYKDYSGTFEYSEEDKIYHGKLLDVNGLVTFEGSNEKELIRAFKDSVNEYIKFIINKNFKY